MAPLPESVLSLELFSWSSEVCLWPHIWSHLQRSTSLSTATGCGPNTASAPPGDGQTAPIHLRRCTATVGLRSSVLEHAVDSGGTSSALVIYTSHSTSHFLHWLEVREGAPLRGRWPVLECWAPHIFLGSTAHHFTHRLLLPSWISLRICPSNLTTFHLAIPDYSSLFTQWLCLRHATEEKTLLMILPMLPFNFAESFPQNRKNKYVLQLIAWPSPMGHSEPSGGPKVP
jgi:hypothetical protein